jgi:hypothetical protein
LGTHFGDVRDRMLETRAASGCALELPEQAISIFFAACA